MTITLWIFILAIAHSLANTLLLTYSINQEGYEIEDRLDVVLWFSMVIFFFFFAVEWIVVFLLVAGFKLLFINTLQPKFYWKLLMGYYNNLEMPKLTDINKKHYCEFTPQSGFWDKLIREHLNYQVKLINRRNNYIPPADDIWVGCLDENTHIYESETGNRILIRDTVDVSAEGKYLYPIKRYCYYYVPFVVFRDYMHGRISNNDMMLNANMELAYFSDVQDGKQINNFTLSVYDVPEEYLADESWNILNYNIKGHQYIEFLRDMIDIKLQDIED